MSWVLIHITDNTGRPRAIGYLNRETRVFTKQVRESVHLFRALDAWGMDAETLHRLLPRDYRIVVRDTETGITYTTSARVMAGEGIYKQFIDRTTGENNRAQVFLPRRLWKQKKSRMTINYHEPATSQKG